MGRLARAAYRDISYGNNWNLVSATFQHADVEQRVSKLDAQAVEPTQWQKLLVDDNEVALHKLSNYELSIKNYALSITHYLIFR